MELEFCEFCQIGQNKLKRHLDSCRTRYLILNKNKNFLETLDKYEIFKEEKKNYESQVERLNKRIYDLELQLQEILNEKRKFESDLSRLMGGNFETVSPTHKNLSLDVFEGRISTQKLRLYQSVWQDYKNFVTRENKGSYSIRDGIFLNVDSANNYIKSIRNSSVSRTKQILKFILSYFMNFPVKLMRISNSDLHVKPKFSFDQNSLCQYLENQFKINYDDYVLQCFLACFGLRIHTASLLQIKHFKDLPNNIIYLPDLKTKTNFLCKVSNRFKIFISEYLPVQNIDSETYLFSSMSEGIRRKLEATKKRINRRIKKGFLNLNIPFDGQTCSSHIFRKTNCFNFFQNGLRRLIDESGMGIGHIPKSCATKSYIYSNHERWLPENPIPLMLKDGQILNVEKREEEKEINLDQRFLRIKRKRLPESLPKQVNNTTINKKKKFFRLKCKTKKNEFLINFYRLYFGNWSNKMENFVDKHLNLVYFSKSKILAAVTFKNIKIKNLNMVDIVLLAVDSEERGKGLGVLMIETLRQLTPRLVTWADNDVVNFYTQKLNFQEANDKLKLFETKVEYFNNSIFCISGFSEEDLLSLTP